MKKKRDPIDLVGRLASRLDLAPQEPPAVEEPPPPVALRVAANPASPPVSGSAAALPSKVAQVTPFLEPRLDVRPEPRVVRQPTRVEPSLTAPRVARPEAPVQRPPVRPEGPVAPTLDAGSPAPTVDRAVAPSRPAADGTPPGDQTLDAPLEDQTAHTDAVPAPVPMDGDAGARRAVELNLVRLQKEGFLTPQSQRSLIAEEYRIIKRPLLRAAFDHANDPANLNHVVMITSARPGEGKTFTAINLAMSVATERDLYVLLVDCDIRRMGLSKKLGVADRKGLMDVLMDTHLNVSDVILRTNIPNLAIIPSGQPIEAATEVFASAQMTTLVDDLASRYPDRFIIFDAPPVLASSEPGVLAVHVGQTVMVVHANETSKRAVAQSIPLINGCPNVHFVLNRVTIAAGPDRFGYYGTY